MATVREPKALELAETPAPAVPTLQVRELADRLREQMRTLIRKRSLRDPLGRIAPDLTAPQVHAIIALGIDEAPLSMSTLAQRVEAALPAATGIVDRLERDGYVERLRDDSDRRVVLVGLTEKGRTTFRQADEHMDVMVCHFLAALPEADRANFVEMISRAIGIVCGFTSKPPTDQP